MSQPMIESAPNYSRDIHASKRQAKAVLYQNIFHMVVSQSKNIIMSNTKNKNPLHRELPKKK